MKNHIIDDGFYIPDNPGIARPKPEIRRSAKATREFIDNNKYRKLGVETFQKVLASDSGELRFCHKLKPAHLEVEGQGRQNVRIAAQTLSRTVAKAVAYVDPAAKAEAAAIQVCLSKLGSVKCPLALCL